MNYTKKAVINAKVVLESGIIWDGVILIEDEIIVQVGDIHNVQIPKDAKCIDADGAYVGPGFVDLHVHGTGYNSTYFKPEAAADYFLSRGTTTIMATPPYQLNLTEFLDAIRISREAMKHTKVVKGLYLEGPYINVKYGAYAHLNPWRGPINSDEFKALVDAAGEDAKVWTIAPEREGLLPFLEYARKVAPDVVFAVGHSEATPEQIRKLGKYRPTLQTHSMCATGRLPVFDDGTRDFGPDEYCFREPDVYCELISDSCGAHVHSEMQQLLLHTKGVHRVVLITDSAAEDETFPVQPVPPELAHVTDLNFDDMGGLAGSKLTMDMVCRNIMKHTNCGICQAFIMASLNPAKVIGMDDEIGSIAVGKKADLVFVDDMFNVKKVMLSGDICEF